MTIVLALYIYLMLVDRVPAYSNEEYPDLLVATTGSITLFSSDVNRSRILMNASSSICSIDYISYSEIYYKQCNSQNIYRLAANGSYVGELDVVGKTDSGSFVIDWINLKIYSLVENWIDVQDIEDDKRKIFYSGCSGTLHSMVLDPLAGQIFWSCSALNSTRQYIGKSGMDGGLVDVIIYEDVDVISFLTLDLEERRVYWIDVKLKQISSASYNGSNIFKHTQQLLPLTEFFAVYQNVTIMPSESDGHQGIYACLKTVDFSCSLLYDVMSNEVQSLMVYDSYLKKPDINPCTNRCKEFCLLSPYPPYYSCQCPDYYYTGNGTTCESPPLFLFADFNYMRLSDINGDNAVKFNTGNRGDTLGRIDYMYDRDLVFWALETDEIGRTGITLHHPVMIKTKDVVYFAVDWVTTNIYYTTKTYSIKVVTLEHNFIKTLIYTDIYDCYTYYTKLALDPIKGYIFWFCYGGEQIIRSSMNGHNDSSLFVNQTESYITAFTLDLMEEKVYWMSAFSPFIASRRYDGRDPEIIMNKVVYSEYGYFYHSIAKFENVIYFVVLESLFSLKKSAKWYRKVMPVNFLNWKLFHGSLQPKVQTPCSINNGNCSHLCLLSPVEPFYSCECPDDYVIWKDDNICKHRYPCTIGNGGCSHICMHTDHDPFFYCACHEGVTLMGDNMTCSVEFERVILITSAKDGVWKVWLDNNNVTKLEFTTPSRQSDVISRFDPVDQHIYWTDSRRNEPDFIQRSRIDGTDKMLTYSKANFISYLTLDWIGRRYYFIQKLRTEPRSIYVSKLDGNDTQIFVFNVFASALAVDQFSGYLYWYSKTEHISKISTDTEDDSILVETRGMFSYETLRSGTFRYSMVVDSKLLRMYMSHSKGIVSFFIDGTGRRTYYTEDTPHGLYITGNLIYWGGTDCVYLLNTSESSSNSSIVYNFFESSGFTSSSWVSNIENVTLFYTQKDMKRCSKYAECLGVTEHITCLNSSIICDGKDDCYAGHDEIYCSVCDETCFVQEFSLFCPSMPSRISISDIEEVSSLVAWESHPLSKYVLLQDVLNSECQLNAKFSGFEDNFNGLSHLNIRKLNVPRIFRQVVSSKTFRHFENTIVLDISGKAIFSALITNPFSIYKNLSVLSITYTPLRVISNTLLEDLTSLMHLNISHNAIRQISSGALRNLPYLLSVDIRGNDIPLVLDLFRTNDKLTRIYSDLFTFCCIKPDSVTEENCIAPENSISSCSDLIKYDVLKVCLWIMGFLAATVNAMALALHAYKHKIPSNESFQIFVRNLAISDIIMGIYMLIIASHDLKFKGLYFENEFWWTNSLTCKICGVIAMASSESSVLFICIITIDRFLAVRFPFKTIYISRKIAHLISILIWLGAVAFAVTPVFLYSEFFSKSGVCIALPFNANIEDDYIYSASVFLGLNSLLFLFVVIGQIAIYTAVQKSSMIVSTQQKERNKMVAMLLFTVAMTDALCWIPIAILGLVSANGIMLPNEVYSWMVVFVLPVNSAINPFIYTILSACRGQGKKAKIVNEDLKRGTKTTS